MKVLDGTHAQLTMRDLSSVALAALYLLMTSSTGTPAR